MSDHPTRARAGSALLAEGIGTFALVFIGAGSAIASVGLLNAPSGQALLNVALANGLVLAIVISAIGHVSGGHVNPAVTFGFLVTRRLPWPMGFGYIAMQLLGAIIAAWLLRSLFPYWTEVDLGTPVPAFADGVGPLQGAVIEAVLTAFWVFTVFGTAVDPRAPRGASGFAVGLVLAFDILAGGPLTGAAMNPARALGPALVSGSWTAHWVYWVGPLLGGAIAAWIYHGLLLPKTERTQTQEGNGRGPRRKAPLDPGARAR